MPLRPKAPMASAVSGASWRFSQIHEIARCIGELAPQLCCFHTEQRRELCLLARPEHGRVGWNRPDRLDRCRYRERFAVPVDDLAAGRRDFNDPRIARVALFLEEVGVDRLQVQRARGEHRECGNQHGEHHARAPHRQAYEALRGRAHREGVTTRTRRGSGARMPRVPVAMRSTR
jgi:hypothetical protein